MEGNSLTPSPIKASYRAEETQVRSSARTHAPRRNNRLTTIANITEKHR
jgi:hypothetical protein